jgi:hypothetical protein
MYYIEESLKFCQNIIYIHCTSDSEAQAGVGTDVLTATNVINSTWWPICGTEWLD